MPPLQLNDEEMTAVMQAAGPIHPRQRDDFMRTLSAELERYSVVGPGLVHRLAADLQRKYVIDPQRGA
jgi:hypothetical protein